jgi:hypothetical protein
MDCEEISITTLTAGALSPVLLASAGVTKRRTAKKQKKDMNRLNMMFAPNLAPGK